MIVGDSKTGKSNIFERFLRERDWNSNLIPTVAVDFLKRIVPVLDKRISLQVWDTSGAERFRSLVSMYYKESRGVLLVYDITNRDSFLHVHDWLRYWRRSGERGARIFLIGNKCDLEDEREVSFEEGRLLAEEKGMKFFEISARTLENFNYMVGVLAKELLIEFIKENESIGGNNVSHIPKNKEDNSKSGCNIW